MSNHLNDPSRGEKSILTSPNTHSYLPPEIWGQIFRSLSPRDLISVADACSEWNELLASEKKHALLELVLPLLNVSKSDILTCRTVSRGGKKMVDNLLENFAEERQSFQFAHEVSIRRRNFINTIHEINDSYDFRVGLYEAGMGKTARQFLTHVGETLNRDNNPFLTRGIKIPLDVDGDEYTATERILTLFGHHVWSLSAAIISDVDDEDIENDRVIPTKKFVRLLNLVPNLRSLNLSSDGSEPIDALRPEELPELKHLVKLSFRNWISRIELVPLAFLRRYGQQLIELRDTCNDSLLQLNQLNVQVLNELLPNLKKLRLRRTFGSALPKLAKVNWRLEELTLSNFYRWKIRDVFNIIGNFSETLVQLQLNDELPSLRDVPVSILGIPGHPCKELPKLQVLRLNTDFANVERYSWFWNSVGTMCSHIRKIYFDNHYIPTEPRYLEVNAAKLMFVKLPNLERILYWEYKQDDRNLSVHVRADYVTDVIRQSFWELLLQKFRAPART